MKKLIMTSVTLSLVLVGCANQPTNTASLYEAVKAKDVSQVKMLIDDGADINVTDNIQWAPLHYAAQAGDTAMAKLLLAWRADPNAKDLDAWTPLHLASKEGHAALVELLVINGADINAMAAKDATGRLSAMAGLLNPDEELVVHETYDWTPLLAAATNNHQTMVELLLANGADVNAKTRDGETALLFAIHEGNTTLVELLVVNGADVNAKMKNAWTLLHEATHKGYNEVAEVLLKNGAEVNAEAKGKDNWTPLHYAVQEDHATLVGILHPFQGV